MKKTMSLTGKILLATLISLLLSGALFVVSPAHAASPPIAGAVAANVLTSGGTPAYSGNGPFQAYADSPNETLNGPSYGPGYTFWVYVDVINVTNLFLYQVGFKFNTTALQIINCTGPGTYTQVHHGAKKYPTTNFFLSAASPIIANATKILTTANSNVTGKVPAEGFYCTDPTSAENGSGPLLAVCFCINPVLSHAVTAARMMNFSLTETDIELILVWTDGSTKISPLPNNVINGYFTLPTIPEFPSTLSSILLATVLILATFAAALLSVTTRSRKRKRPDHNRQA